MIKVTLLILGIFLVSGLNPAWADSNPNDETGVSIHNFIHSGYAGIRTSPIYAGQNTKNYANFIHSGYAGIGPSSIYAGGNTESIGPSSIFAGGNTESIGPSSIYAGGNTESIGPSSIFAGWNTKYDSASPYIHLGKRDGSSYYDLKEDNIKLPYNRRKRKREQEKVTLEGTIIIEAEGSRSETVVLEVKDGTETIFYTLVGEQAEALKEHKGKQVKIEGVKTYSGWSINQYPRIQVNSWNLLPPAEFMEEIEALKEEYSELIEPLMQAIEDFDLEGQIADLEEAKETAIEAVEEEFNNKLATAREEFMDKLAAAIEEGRWEDIAGIAIDYLEERRGIIDDKNEAIKTLEDEFASEIQALRDNLAALEDALNAFREEAKLDIEALCEKYDIPYSEEYLDMVIPPSGIIPGFTEGIEELKQKYSELADPIIKKIEDFDLEGQIADLEEAKETAIEAVEEEFNNELKDARKKFIDDLITAIKEGEWEDIVGIVKAYMEERRGIIDDKNEAIKILEEEFASDIQALRDDLAALEKDLDELREEAKAEVEALCEKHGIPYSEEYLDMVIPPSSIIPGFTKGIEKLKQKYSELADPIIKEIEEFDLEGQIADLEEAKETAIEAVEEEFNNELKDARKKFIDDLITAIKEGEWEDIVGIVKAYMEERRGIIDDKNEAIKILEEEFASDIQALRDDLAALEKDLDELREEAKAEVEALCEKHGIPYSEEYLNMVFPPSDIPGLLNIEVIGPNEFYKLSSEERDNYVSIARSLWANKDDVYDYALANPDELPGIGADEYYELSAKQKKEYVLVGKSLWVKKSDIREVARSIRKREYDEELPVGIGPGEPDNSSAAQTVSDREKLKEYVEAMFEKQGISYDEEHLNACLEGNFPDIFPGEEKSVPEKLKEYVEAMFEKQGISYDEEYLNACLEGNFPDIFPGKEKSVPEKSIAVSPNMGGITSGYYPGWKR